MAETEKIIIKVEAPDISIENYSIKELIEILQQVNKTLGSLDKEHIISYYPEKGSVNHIFLVSPYVSKIFSEQLSEIQKNNYEKAQDIMPLVEFLQKQSYKQKYSYNLQAKTISLKIDQTTKYIRKDIWVKTTLYIYGEIVQAGGKAKPNIHIDTEDYGIVIAEIDKNQLKNKTLLYKTYGIKVECEQNLQNNELRNAKVLELIPYRQTENWQKYLSDKIALASENWKNVDKEEWLKTIRK